VEESQVFLVCPPPFLCKMLYFLCSEGNTLGTNPPSKELYLPKLLAGHINLSEQDDYFQRPDFLTK